MSDRELNNDIVATYITEGSAKYIEILRYFALTASAGGCYVDRDYSKYDFKINIIAESN